MTGHHLTLGALATGLLLATAGGCPRHTGAFTELDVRASAEAHEAGATFVDANGEDYRKKHGVVPGAVLLANYRTYDADKVLPDPKDQHLVFYCSSRL